MYSNFVLLAFAWTFLLLLGKSSRVLTGQVQQDQEPSGNYSASALLEHLFSVVSPPAGNRSCLDYLNQTGVLAQCADTFGTKWHIEKLDSSDAEYNMCMAMFAMMECINAASCTNCTYREALEIKAYRLKVMNVLDQIICPKTYYWWARDSCQGEMTRTTVITTSTTTTTPRTMHNSSTPQVSTPQAYKGALLIGAIVSIAMILVIMAILMVLLNNSPDSFIGRMKRSLKKAHHNGNHTNKQSNAIPFGLIQKEDKQQVPLVV